MTNIKKIMVALAFSDYAKGTFTFAANIAKSLDADLLVVSIINNRDVEAVQTISAMGYDVDGEHYIESIRNQRRDLLTRFQSEIDFPAERVDIIFRTGNPIDELLKVCVEQSVDMIVMGVKGRTNLESVFVGSVAEKMFRRAPVTVVSYRDPANAAKLKKRIHLKP